MTVKKPILKKLQTNQTAVNGMIANHNSSQLPAITSSKHVKIASARCHWFCFSIVEKQLIKFDSHLKTALTLQ